MAAYYNEHDLFAAQWLRNLIAAGHIAPGEVDTRSIEDVTVDDLRGFQQCHFFAGIGVWSRALRDAGWPDDRMVWTGSCPCQPFSAAGKGAGFADERHLWPAWHHLIEERRPPVVFGEQVASALLWLDLVSTDMEAAGYAFGASDLCAAGFGGAHIRQRLYFVGLQHAESDGREQRRPESSGRSAAVRCSPCRLADDDDARLERRRGVPECADQCTAGPGGVAGGLEYADGPGEHGRPSSWEQPLCVERDGTDQELAGRDSGPAPSRWHDVDWLLCRNPAGEPSWRPVEPGTFPLAHAVAGRMDKLRAYGNGLDLETATGFVGAVMDALGSP